VGFLYRAVFGSLRNFIRGWIPFQSLITNWGAALSLPFIHLGLAKDFWREFDDRYLELEKGLHSTFFLIPFKGRAGKNSHGPAPRFRAARYAAQEIADTTRKLLAAGCEIGLHGIDAWLDKSAGQEEMEEIRRLTGASEIGVRMHWLYHDHQTPATLEKVGAAYDSTVGYNETVGYRAGTTQAYKPFEASHLLELPLHVMDTALFYPGYLELSPPQARTLLGRMIDNAVRFGGCLTINWHDRSIAPERMWNTSYRDLIQDLKSRGAWFATAGQAISWSRKRRLAAFEADYSESGAVRANVVVNDVEELPGLRLRIHNAGECDGTGSRSSEGYLDMTIDENVETRVPLRKPLHVL
jgi:peptidoglycan/xylan/chitin deacetylase (PgdA/CDA1 family)